jgi:hypothetical protein
MEYAAAEAYDKVDPKQLVALRARHARIVEPNSWIGIELFPKFDLNGNLISTDKLVH